MKRQTVIWLIPLLAAILAAGSSLYMLSQGAKTAAGIPVLTLDDAYIHLQYGWQGAQGRFLEYNTGDAPSTGATSLLYMLLLAAGFALGIPHDGMASVAVGAGSVLFVVGAALLADLTRRLSDRLAERAPLDDTPPPLLPVWSASLIAGLLFAGSGWMAWAYLSGMETGLLITLIIAALWAFVGGRVRLTALLTALAVTTRPEVVILAVVMLAAQILRDPAETNDRRRRFLWGCVPVAAVLIQPLFNLVVTGSPSASGMLAKSWFTVQPFYLDRTLGVVAVTAVELAAKLFGGPALDGRWHALPLAQAFGLVGLGLLWTHGRVQSRRLVLIALGWLVLGIGATSTLQTATWHHYRYQMPLYPVLVVPLALALAALASEAAARLRANNLPVGGVVVLGLVLIGAWTVYTLHDFGQVYALDTSTTASQQMVLANWLAENTEEDALVAVHDVGVMRFVGGRQVYDVVGLTTDGMATISRSGPGAIYERLEQVQPDYFAVYPDVAMPFFGIDDAPTLLGEELARVTIDPWSRNTSADDTQVVTRPDWSNAPLADMPRQPHMLEQLEGWTLVDRLDVADIDDENAHEYRWWHSDRPDGYLTEPRVMAYHDAPEMVLADGGRTVSGGASFVLHTPQTGEWVTLVARLHQLQDMTLRVRVNGADAGLWRLPALPDEWLESAFLIPSSFVLDEHTTITLDVATPETGGRYAAFYYWAYQGEPVLMPQAPGTVSGAAFGDIVRLRGYDLPGRTFASGDMLPLTLHWEALNPPQADHRIAVHLLDPENDTAEGIIAQVDGVPRGGTYPFWVWRPHEAVSETVSLAIPAGAAPGRYLLLVMVYDGVTFERVPIVGGDDFGASRLILGPVDIR